MPAQRRLSEHQLIAARWEYEVTEIGARPLAMKFGVSRHSIREWIRKQGWTKAHPLRCYAGDAGQQRFQDDVRAAIGRALDKKPIPPLEETLMLPAAGKWPTPAEPARRADAIAASTWELPADQPKLPKINPETGPESGASMGKRRPAAATVVRVSGAYLPPLSPNKAGSPTAFPLRSRTEVAALRVQLSTLRGELALQQMRQLETHNELLWEYHHLLSVFLNPGKHVDVTGLDAEQAAARLDEVSRQAGRLALPTERDTLAGAIAALSKALIATLAATRSAAGVNPRQLRGGGPPCDQDEAQTPRTAALDLSQLRYVRGAMELLNGNAQRNTEPPQPPPPEGVDDLVVKRDEVPREA
jgi:hypothetical protein